MIHVTRCLRTRRAVARLECDLCGRVAAGLAAVIWRPRTVLAAAENLRLAAEPLGWCRRAVLPVTEDWPPEAILADLCPRCLEALQATGPRPTSR